MPHLVLDGRLDCHRVVPELGQEVHRWGRAVLKLGGAWLRQDGGAALVEGVVVELARPLHPVALVMPHERETVVRLWPTLPVERTRAVQRWLAVVAAALQRHGAGAVTTTNLGDDLLVDLGLVIADRGGAAGKNHHDTTTPRD